MSPRKITARCTIPLLALTVTAACLVSPARADVRIHRLFSDDMILQRDAEVPVQGRAAPGEAIQVTFGDQALSTAAGPDGKWMVKLSKMPASAAPQDMSISGKNTIVLRNILVGDVWLCSGQSNMAFSLGGCNAPGDIQAADCPSMRFTTLPIICKPRPTEDVETSEGWFRWYVCRPDNAAGISAVAFYFARRIQKETRVPMGLLVSSVGGTNIEKWMAQESFRGRPELAGLAREIDDRIAEYHKDLAAYLDQGIAENFARLNDWKPLVQKALAEKKDVPDPPQLADLPLHPSMPGSRAGGNWLHLYNGMISPLMKFPIRGAIWYQGENNSEEIDSYVAKMDAMISSWRKGWGSDFPFYYVQLASWLRPNDIPSGEDNQYKWQRCREAQLKVLSKVPKTGMAVIVDCGDADDIHPRNKRDVGERLALWALRNDYGKTDLVCSGPLYKGMKVEGSRIRIRFDHVGGGLMAAEKKGLEPAREVKGGALKKFAVAGEDKVWRWAEARIDGETVVVASPDVPKPVAVRYAYTINPEGANLYNREGLPASPFRTDAW